MADNESGKNGRAAKNDRRDGCLAIWSIGVIGALLFAVLGTLLLALKQGPPVQNERPSQNAGQNLTLDLDVNAVAESPEPVQPQQGTSSGPQTIDFTLNDHRSFSPSVTVPPAGNGPAGRDLVVVLDREKVVGKTTPDENGPKPCEESCISCEDDDGSGVAPDPCATVELIARVRFEPGKRRIISWHEAQNGEIRSIGQIAQDLEKSAEAEQRRFPAPTAALLVVGHTDPGHTGSCLRSSLGKRRAKKVRRALRRLNERLGEIRIYAQAAGDEPMAPEGSCEARYYGTVGVYLIEGMR